MRLILISLLALAVTGCGNPDGTFNLPPGDAERGRATFILSQCNHCHSVQGDAGVPYDGADRAEGIHVVLGGPAARVKSYGDLVTSIINPSHKLSRGDAPGTVTETGESTMRPYNDVMTVQELIDLVEYLQGQYEIWVPKQYVYKH